MEPLSANTERHVAPEGDDAHPTGTPQRPWRTLHRAVRDARPGDRIVVHDGVYLLDRPVEIRCQGRPDAWIVIAAAPGARPVFDAYAVPPIDRQDAARTGAIHLEEARYLRIEGLHLINSCKAGFYLHDCSHVELRACRAERTFAPAIGLRHGEYLRVVGCEIARANTHDRSMPDQSMRGECPHEALSVMGTHHFEIAWNHLHDCEKEGIDVKERSAHGIVHHNYVHDLPRQALYADAWFGLLHDVEFCYNLAHDCEWGMTISVEGKDAELRGVHVHHNILTRHRGSGIYFGVWGSNGPRSDIAIHHNTLHRNGYAEHWAGPTGSIHLRAAQSRDVRVVGNICSDGGCFEIATFVNPEREPGRFAELGLVAAGNLLAPRRAAYSAAPAPLPADCDVFAWSGERPLQADPGFADLLADDFSLREDSRAVGALSPEDAALVGDAEDRDLGALAKEERHFPNLPVQLEGFEDYRPRVKGWPEALGGNR